MINPLNLTGKQILVAGGFSEIGEAVLIQLTRLGANVIVADSSNERPAWFEKNEELKNIRVFIFDLYNSKEIEPNADRINTECGPFQGFIYNAGIGGVRPLSLTNEAFTHQMMNANLYTFIEMTRCITKKNRFSQGGSIVAISSVSSVRGLKSKTIYSASKAALDAAVRCIAAELSSRKIRVNTILKGYVESDMKQEFIKSNMELNDNEDFRRQILGPSLAIEIANTAAFLVSDATKTITGTSMVVDGGFLL